jgi:hypothetical protein
MSPAEALDYTRVHYDGSAAPPGPSPYSPCLLRRSGSLLRTGIFGDHRADISIRRLASMFLAFISGV